MTNSVVSHNRHLSQREKQALNIIAFQALWLGIASAFIYVAAYTLFVVKFEANIIPYVYIAIGLSGTLAFYGLGSLQKRQPPIRTIPLIYLVYLALTAAMWLLLVLEASPWIILTLLVLYDLAVRADVIALGGEMGSIFNLRQLKRLYPIVYGPVVAGYISAALAAPALAQWLGRPEHLLLLTMVAHLIILSLFVLLRQRFGTELTRLDPAAASASPQSFFKLIRSRFPSRLLLYQMLSAIGTQLVIYIFLVQADLRFTTAASASRFFGNFAGYRNLISIIFLLVVAGWLMQRYGLRFGLIINPAIVMLLALGLLATQLAAPAAVDLIFWATILTYVIDNLLSDGITQTAIKTAYQVLPVREQAAVETAVEGIGVPLAFGLTGISLLLFNSFPTLTLSHILTFTIIVCALWLATAVSAYRGYITMLMHQLTRRSLRGETVISLDDGSTLAVVENFLTHAESSRVELALNLLADADHPSLAAHATRLLSHGNAAVRLAAYTTIEQKLIQSATPLVKKNLESEPDTAVKGQALQTLSALQQTDAVETVAPYRRGTPYLLQRGALVGLLRNGGIDGMLLAAERLMQLTSSADPADRILAAEVLEQVGERRYYATLTTLLQDKSVQVRQAALKAVATVRHPNHTAGILKNLSNVRTRSAALVALQANGEAGLPAIHHTLSNGAQIGEAATRNLIKVCGLIGGKQAHETLLSYLEGASYENQGYALSALNLAGYAAAEETHAPLLLAYVGRGLRILTAKDALQPNIHTALLHHALDYEFTQVRQCIFSLLAFSYPTGHIERAGQLFETKGNRQTALALETLEMVLSPYHKSIVLPLLETDGSIPKNMRKVLPQFDLRLQTLEGWLTEMTTDAAAWPLVWTRACARYAQRGLALKEAAGDLTLTNLPGKNEEETMHTIEKVATLRTLDIFAGIPDYVLASVADISAEVEVTNGKTFIQEGATEACMYIVVDGQVKVHSQGKTIIELGAGKSVGELAVLDPKPRAAAVTAVTDTFLLRIDKSPFDEVMADRPEIAHGIIQMLCGRLREQGRFLVESNV